MCLCASPLMSTSSFDMYAVIMHLMYPYFSRLQGKIEATIRFGKGIPMPTYYYSDYCRQICIKIFPVTCVTRIIQFIGCCAVCFNIFPFISVFIFFLSIYLCVIYLSIYPSIQLPIDIKCSRFITWICGLVFIDRFHVIFVFIILYQIFTIDNITHTHIYIYIYLSMPVSYWLKIAQVWTALACSRGPC